MTRVPKERLWHLDSDIAIDLDRTHAKRTLSPELDLRIPLSMRQQRTVRVRPDPVIANDKAPECSPTTDKRKSRSANRMTDSSRNERLAGQRSSTRESDRQLKKSPTRPSRRNRGSSASVDRRNRKDKGRSDSRSRSRSDR